MTTDNPETVERVAAKLAASDGLDWNEVCAYEADENAEFCDSSTCVAARYEDHEPDVARAEYRKWAKVALAEALATLISEPAKVGEVEREDGEPCQFVECRPGLFRYRGTLCFKSEYESKPGQPDAYCVDNGEYFWGGTRDLAERGALIVQPVAAPHPDTALVEALELARDVLQDAWRTGVLHTNGQADVVCRSYYIGPGIMPSINAALAAHKAKQDDRGDA